MISNPMAAIKERLQGRPDSEHRQALVRLAVTGLSLVYMTAAAFIGNQDWKVCAPAFFVVLVEVVIGLALMAAIIVRPGHSDIRRWIGMLADYSSISALMVFLGEVTAPLYVVLLWVTVGNGLRYGQVYLIASSILVTTLFLIVILYTPYWQENIYLATSLLFGLIFFSIYLFLVFQYCTLQIRWPESPRSEGGVNV